MPKPMLRCTFSVAGVCLTLSPQPTGAIALRSTPGLDSILWFALTACSQRHLPGATLRDGNHPTLSKLLHENTTHTCHTVAGSVHILIVLLALAIPDQKCSGIRRHPRSAQSGLPVRHRCVHFLIPRCEVGSHFHGHHGALFRSRRVI